MNNINIGFYEPRRVLITEHDGVRWFSDTYLLVPLRSDELWGLPTTPGEYSIEEDDYLDTTYARSDATDEVVEKVAGFISDATPLNTRRLNLRLSMWPRDDASASVYVHVGDAAVSRILIEVAEAITEKHVDGFGDPRKQGAPLTLYSGAKFVGLLMPVRIAGAPCIVNLGREVPE